MDYKKLSADLLSGCEENCADCEYAGDSEFECTIAQLAATAITDLLAQVHELETTHRTEMCEDGYDCVSLGQARKAQEEAEARADRLSEELKACTETDLAKAHEALSADWSKWRLRGKRAERCIAEIEDALTFGRYSAAMLRIAEYRGQKEE